MSIITRKDAISISRSMLKNSIHKDHPNVDGLKTLLKKEVQVALTSLFNQKAIEEERTNFEKLASEVYARTGIKPTYTFPTRQNVSLMIPYSNILGNSIDIKLDTGFYINNNWYDIQTLFPDANKAKEIHTIVTKWLESEMAVRDFLTSAEKIIMSCRNHETLKLKYPSLYEMSDHHRNQQIKEKKTLEEKETISKLLNQML